MRTMLLKNIQRLATMDAHRRELSGSWILIRGNVIDSIGSGEPPKADEVMDLSEHLALPGLVNTHHHMFQCLTRVMGQNEDLFGWLKACYTVWGRMRAEHARCAARLAMAELLLSGCTTASDHHYVYPNDVSLEDDIQAAEELGIRFHAARGSMSVGEGHGGLPPDDLIENEAEILRDTQRLIETWHDPAPQSMLRIVVAPCSPFSVSVDLMRESAALARAYGVSLHTHLAETEDDVAYSLAQFGLKPGDYAEDVGWLGEDVWHAHCVKLDRSAIDRFAKTGTGVCHCPSSNMRLASGIAPIRQMLDRGVKVGLGVDGSASNDSGHLLAEARQALLLQRAQGNPKGLAAREALELATLGGARVLGREDIGSIEPGMSADIIAYRLDNIAFAGALHDPVAALLFCQPQQVDLSIINGRVIVRDGQLLTRDLPRIIEAQNRASLQLIRDES